MRCTIFLSSRTSLYVTPKVLIFSWNQTFFLKTAVGFFFKFNYWWFKYAYNPAFTQLIFFEKSNLLHFSKTVFFQIMWLLNMTLNRMWYGNRFHLRHFRALDSIHRWNYLRKIVLIPQDFFDLSYFRTREIGFKVKLRWLFTSEQITCAELVFTVVLKEL